MRARQGLRGSLVLVAVAGPAGPATMAAPVTGPVTSATLAVLAARMGTSQSAVARLESGDADVRASTLERYAAAIGSQITWQLRG